MNWIPFETYRQILLSVPIACVDIAIVSEGRILLVERMDAPAEGQYWLPGGRVHKGELLKDGASRKALVEVGIAYNVGSIVHTAETIFDDGPDGIVVHSVNTYFFLFPKDRNIRVKLDDHHTRHLCAGEIGSDLQPYVRRCLLAAILQGPSAD